MNPLSRLSNSELEANLKNLVQKERKLLHVILEHIREIDSRRLFLEKAYSSIYEYLTKELGYSGSAAMRRLEAARLIHDVPQVASRIQEGLLNLSQIGELARAIKEKEKLSGDKVSPKQKRELVEVVLGKTTQSTQHESRCLDLPLKQHDAHRLQKDESVRLELTLSKEQFEKLLRCKDLAAHILLQENGTISFPEVIEFLAGRYLDEKFKKKSSAKKLLNEEEVGEIEGRLDSANASDEKPAILTTDAAVERKSVTPKLRRLVFARDERCQFIHRNTGEKCNSAFALQVDHKIPKWNGGGNALNNLQLLCAEHNREKYRRETNLQMKR
ncbi:HNH endonuclease [Bdellovibrio reynosensis]|uniref:HNH endonuclease n=1 Tax=Bdellovibrio reynosensis TaxID=2835041 RepID=A0ABY4C8H1_9BACT|nr:HNH endonuclease signature motif containing protein [Bdellovibrio reynosensis]UOF01173.1 HNH endonuclease [Bdellovibrio reynosensis]